MSIKISKLKTVTLILAGYCAFYSWFICGFFRGDSYRTRVRDANPTNTEGIQFAAYSSLFNIDYSATYFLYSGIILGILILSMFLWHGKNGGIFRLLLAILSMVVSYYAVFHVLGPAQIEEYSNILTPQLFLNGLLIVCLGLCFWQEVKMDKGRIGKETNSDLSDFD